MAINNRFTRKYSEWVQSWRDKNVHDLNSTYDFVSSESTLLVSGPPEFKTQDDANISEELLIPIGLVQTASISQQKQIQQLNEIGSRQLFTIPGRTYATASVARILFDGPSLLFAMSAYYKEGTETDTVMIPAIQQISEGEPTNPYPAGNTVENGMQELNLATGGDTLGAYWGNLGSTVFNKPMGLGFIFLDTESDFYGGLYLEKCFIASYNIGISAQQTILLENVQIRATRIRPVQFSGNA